MSWSRTPSGVSLPNLVPASMETEIPALRMVYLAVAGMGALTWGLSWSICWLASLV